MPRLTVLTLASGILTIAAAQSSTTSGVTSFFFPLADQQPLVASVVAADSTANTLVVQCVSDLGDLECGFPAPITITAGPSTLHVNPTGIYQALGELDCQLTGTSDAVCAITAPIYDPEYLAMVADEDFPTEPATSSSTTTVSGLELQITDYYVTVTITAGELGLLDTSTSPTATGSTNGTESTSGTASRTSRSITTGSATGSSSAGPASATGNIAARLSGVMFSGVAAGMMVVPLFLL
ncbi:hypothetical protein LTS08_001227 [Lithohypha guttulata]|uniref:Uncharacterized protein n=1 Tax=Lithohypha guttulata TaxID=1690604 RepID=A0AAN7SU79_9EURO|nr:hypothetical protein LTR05_007781 [Lithohypha guttulata]KAK5104954.1 hypothetical protein LTS08_001227 [Lithohypha guttulata]